MLTSGDPRRRTGGNLYDARLIAAARRAGMSVRVVQARDEMPQARIVVVDSIAIAEGAALVRRPRAHRVIALLHMPVHGARAVAVLRAADAVVCVGTALASDARRVGARHVEVIAPGADGVAALALRRIRRRLLRVLCVANWSRVKGVDVLVRAAARVEWVALDLVGDHADARYASSVQRLARDPRLAGRVRVHGALSGSRLARRYAVADIVAVPSRSEGYGIALAEALRAGLPVVATDLPALRSVARRAAVFVTPGRADALASGLVRLRSAAERQRLVRAARSRAGDLPLWRDAERSWVRLLERELLAAEHGGDHMPPRGVKSKKRTRQYEHIKESELERGRSTKTAKRIAAATTNKTRRKKGETKKKKS